MIRLNETILFFALLILNTCSGNMTNRKVPFTETTSKAESVKIVDLSLDDSPLLVELKFIGNYESDGITYPHIYGIRHEYQGHSNLIDTLYYEHIHRKSNLITKENFYDIKFLPSPGDTMYKLIYQDSVEYIFNVLESDKYARTFNNIYLKRVPTINSQANNGVSTDFEIEFSLTRIENNHFSLTLVDPQGVHTYKYISNCNSIINTRLSYIDRKDYKIYFLDRDCFLERVKSM